MLRITGLITGINGNEDVMYDEEYVKLETIAKQIGHPIPEAHQNFALSAGQKHVNRITRHQHRSEGVRVMARQRMNIRGQNVVIEYLEGTRKKRDGSVTIEMAYPRKITVAERSLIGSVSTSTEFDREKAFYLSLIPSCETSPFHDPARHTARYKLFDPREQAKAQLASSMLKWEAVQQVQDNKLSDLRMMIIAAGMNLNTSGMDISEIKAGLMLRAEQSPKKFSDDFYSMSVMAMGLVTLCRQNNIIKFVGKSGQFYLHIDETLASLTGNSGMQILKGGYATHQLGISALADAVAQNNEVFKMLGDMLDKAMKDGRVGNIRNSAQVQADQGRMDDLFASIGKDNFDALAGAGEVEVPEENKTTNPPAEAAAKKASKKADAAPPVIND